MHRFIKQSEKVGRFTFSVVLQRILIIFNKRTFPNVRLKLPLKTHAEKVIENGWVGLKCGKKESLADVSSMRCLQQADEVSGLHPILKLLLLTRAETGWVEHIRVSDPDDVVEEAEEEKTDEWRQVEV